MLVLCGPPPSISPLRGKIAFPRHRGTIASQSAWRKIQLRSDCMKAMSSLRYEHPCPPLAGVGASAILHFDFDARYGASGRGWAARNQLDAALNVVVPR